MSDIKSILRDVGYFSVGAAAVLIEAGSKAVKTLVRKGEKTLHDNQDTVDDLKRKAKELGEKAKELGEKAKAAMESTAAPEEPTAAEPAVDEPTVDEPIVDEPTVDEPIAAEPVKDESEAPVAPDVIYHAEVPAAEAADEEKPENTVNG